MLSFAGRRKIAENVQHDLKLANVRGKFHSRPVGCFDFSKRNIIKNFPSNSKLYLLPFVYYLSNYFSASCSFVETLKTILWISQVINLSLTSPNLISKILTTHNSYHSKVELSAWSKAKKNVTSVKGK